ncbi:MAG: NAD(P)/FAD-dependent oxidoreductase [Candidatus Promineifilaceae bacterium]
MSELENLAQVVVIGGGVMGASTAYHLALRGCRDVILLEKQPFFGQGATGKCAGGIRYQFSTEINVRLSLLSLPMLDRFEEETGQPIDLRYCGYLFLLTDEADLPQFRANVALQNGLGVPTKWLTPDEVRQKAPQLHAPDCLGATFHAGDGLADPNGVVAGYIAAARRLGVRCHTDTAVTAIRTEQGRVSGVETNRGAIACETVVNAAGPWSGVVSEMVGIPLPVLPIRRQILTTTPLPALDPHFPFVIDFARSLYFHREGEGILTGMSNPNEPPGFDETVDENWEDNHMEAAMTRLPLLEQAGLLAHWAGLYEVTPDAHPIISDVPGLDGYVVVSGFSGHGFMHGPIAGVLTAEIVLDGRAHTLDLSALDYRRFDLGRSSLEYNVV